ncbi:amino acid adenylation domain-containing protein [Brevibacillus laterosporus]|uniref:Amino acid adenylation domain-containing protein n=1 Tax=Brevibacillus halotolerans TaxID=1507437 RepID=A0ABT4HW47_9BACL|nr:MULTISPECIES: non-ribosomal peptide synthetase [Brevibacillus]MCR8984709.1 amino acid adenylation domain-containing protein [Brevibacillus laterosporus]MCZ0830435.1 amino acid adenylation domain-containing protein [Brevibacillus halotolerans]
MGEHAEIKLIQRLSPLQEGMLFHHILDRKHNAYFEQMRFKLEGPLNLEALQKSLNLLIDRYDILRTVFMYEDLEEPIQIVLKQRSTTIHYEDISSLPDAEKSNQVEAFCQQDKAKGFDLTSDLLTRMAVLKTGEATYQVIWSYHHILMDGWCFGIILGEFFEFYKQVSNNLPLKLDAVVPYSHYIQWLENQDREEALAYWKHYLLGYEERVSVPAQLSASPSENGYQPREYLVTLSTELTAKLTRLARHYQVTMNHVFQAVWSILLQRYNNTDDVVFGAVVSGRPSDIPDVERIVGLFINSIPVRVKIQDGLTFEGLLQQVKSAALHCEAYDYVSLADIQQQSSLQQNLFDHLLGYQNYPSRISTDELEQQIGLHISNIEVFEQTNYDFNILAAQSDDQMLIKFIYNGQRFTSDFIQGISGHLIKVMEQISDDPEIVVNQLEIVTDEEKQRLLNQFNPEQCHKPYTQSIAEVFESWAECQKDSIAIVFGDDQLTYKQLNEKANQLARHLQAKGIREERTVALVLDRSIEMIVAMLAILKAGGAYLPIDPQFPAERIGFLLKDAGVQLVLTQAQLMNLYPWRVEAIPVDDSSLYQGDASNLPPQSDGQTLAFIQYTSGSTGNPKGNLTTHSNVLRTVVKPNYVNIREQDRILQLSNYIFDGSIFDIYGALLNGARLVLIKREEMLDITQLARVITKNGVTMTLITTALFNAVVDADLRCLAPLHKILFGGEKVSVHHVRKAMRYLGPNRLIHLYGPSENTVYSTYYSVEQVSADAYTIPIGKPVNQTQLFVLDQKQNLQPIGVPGELCIGGGGLVRGYLDRDELTEEKFIPHPFLPGERIYRTGDVVKWLSDGNLEYVSRLDHLVKIRGYRIEPGEVTHVLLQHPKVQDAIVVDRKDSSGLVYLVAYYVGNGVEPDELRQALGQSLPDYMIPGYFIRMEKLPLTPNGKVDRDQLPEISEQLQQASEYIAPSDDLETVLAQIWEEVLGRSRVGVKDNFFSIGGHSIKATMLASRIGMQLEIDFPLKAVFQCPTIRGMADFIRSATKCEYTAIEKVDHKKYYVTTSAQKRLYVIQQFEGAGTSYNMPLMLSIQGSLDIQRTCSVWRSLVDRHESLRTSFSLVDGVLMQQVHENLEVPFEVREAPEASEAELNKIIEQFIQPFDLSQAPLVRGLIIRVSDTRFVLVVDMHHIISDGVSMKLLVEEFNQLYRGEELPELRIQYKDYASWLQTRMQGGEAARQEEFWRHTFSGELPVLDMPTDYARGSVQQFKGDRYTFTLDEKQTAMINRFCERNQVTLFMTLIAAYNVLLSKYTGQEDIIVGSPIAGRQHAELEPMVGMFVNTLALRNKPTANKSFREFLTEVKENLLNAYEHQDYPLEELIDKLSLRRDLSRNPLFDMTFAVQNITFTDQNLPALTIDNYAYPYKVAKFDMTVQVAEMAGRLMFDWEYSTSLYKRETIERMAGHLIQIISAVVLDSDQLLAQIDMVTTEEKKQLLTTFNDTQVDYPVQQLVHELIEHHAAKRPNHIALVDDWQQLTYQQFNEKANQLARKLRSKGVGSESIVAIIADHSVEMVIALLAVLKAGGAFLPIAPDYPVERMDYMLKEAGSKWLLTHTKLPISLAFDGEILALSDASLYQGETDNLEPINISSNLAYVIFTSGSTGQPKGVMVEHRSLINLCCGVKEKYELTSQDRMTKYAGFGFDATIWEIFPCLTSGATLHLLSDEVRYDIERLHRYYQQHQITVSYLPTQMFELFMEWPTQSLRILNTGGDKLNRFIPQPCRFINNYGPSENTVLATSYEVTKALPNIPIGKPANNVRIHVINRHGQLQPIGVPGELCISGAGLARGYLNRDDLTNTAFTSNPFVEGERMYRTGDIARWLPDGNLEFLGRKDQQVKIRGYRIELGEIESRLNAFETIQMAVVEPKELESKKVLCAYIVADEAPDYGELRKYLAVHLPDYMIPTFYMTLPKLPLTTNGKVDRKALPLPSTDEQYGKQYVAPTNETQELLAKIFADVLGIDRIGIQDNFFELGGDSINAIQIVARLGNYQLKADINQIFLYPTIEELSLYVKQMKSVATQEEIVGEVPLTPIQHWFFAQQMTDQHHWNQSVMLHAPTGLEVEILRAVLTELISYHDALRMIYSMESDGRVIQINRGVKEAGEKAFSLAIIDLRNEYDSAVLTSRIEAEATRIQESLDLTQGPLFKATLFQTAWGDHLLLTIHHLVVDGVSWRILLEDLQTAYDQAQRGEVIQLPAKTHSYQDWARALKEFADNKTIAKEWDYWKKLETIQIQPLPQDYMDGTNTWQSLQSKVAHLTSEETDNLLKHAPQAYHTEINDLLLTALARTIHEWTGESNILVDLEGHGREDIIKEINISRTIGWFTSLYPVNLTISSEHDLSYQIKATKESLRSVPQKGIGYGILAYLAGSDQREGCQLTRKSEISFNYLGQFEQAKGEGLLQPSNMPKGPLFCPNNNRSYQLDVIGSVSEKQLHIQILYSQKHYQDSTIAKLVDRYMHHLRLIINHCLQKEGPDITPSDVGDEELTFEELDDIADFINNL